MKGLVRLTVIRHKGTHYATMPGDPKGTMPEDATEVFHIERKITISKTTSQEIAKLQKDALEEVRKRGIPYVINLNK